MPRISTSTQRRTILGGALASLLLATACSQNPSTPTSPEAAKAPRVVEGTVRWNERMALPPEAELIVRLQDTSRADAPAAVISEQRIQLHGKQPPFQFQIPVDPTRIDQRMTYTVSARVEQAGRLMFINDQSYAVLTRGAGTRVDMVLVRTGG